MNKIDKFIQEYKPPYTAFGTTSRLLRHLHKLLLRLAEATNEDIKELKILLLSHSRGDFTDLEQLQEEFFILQVNPLREGKTKSDGKPKPKGFKGYPPPAPISYIEENKIKSSLAVLLQKAKQIEKEQEFIVNGSNSYHQTYAEGTLIGINRIVRLIERHYKG